MTETKFMGKIKDITKFRDAVTSMAELIDDVNFSIKKDGIRVKASDRSMVSVVDFFMKPSSFETYEVSYEIVLGINLQTLLSFLQRFTSDITIKTEGQLIEIFSDVPYYKKFTIPLLQLNTDVPAMDTLAFIGDVNMDMGMFKTAIGDALLVSDSIIMEADSEKFVLRSTASGGSNYNMNINKGQTGIEFIEKDGKSFAQAARSRFSLDYLNKMVKGTLSDKIKISLGNDFPLKLTQNSENYDMIWILAPRVEESE